MIEELKKELPILNLLRNVFWAEPTQELIEGLGRIDLSPMQTDGTDGLALMVEAIKKNEDRTEEWMEELALEFARLFIGPENPPAIPYASFYLSETHSLMTEETIEIRKQYLEAGVAVKNLYRLPDDHIGIEMDFLYYLNKRLLELYEIGLDREAEHSLKIRNDFLKGHMVLWVPSFAHKITESTQEDFYKGAASFLLEMMEYYSQEP